MYIRYPDELIEEIRINNDIVDVVSEYVKLERRGKNYFGLCPFHREKTPSFSVEPGKQIFYCFGCGKGGNVFRFVQLAENLDYFDAVKLLAERAKITLPESDDDKEAEKARLKKLILNINRLAARYFYDTLNSEAGRTAVEYLKKREISDNTVRKFGLGYSTGEWDGLLRHLKSKGISEEHMIKSGLIVKNSVGKLYDRFRGRLIFPIFDVRGNVIAFGGRVLDNSLPKYVNSNETAVYSKGRHLYALNFAKNSAEKRIIVVEGYMDVISLHQNGIDNAVASLGTALTERQGRVLKKYAEEVIISYDSDSAGQAATIRGLDLLNNIGCNVKVLTIPDGKDPDDFVRKNGPNAFRKLADTSLSLVEYKIRLLKKEHDLTTAEGKVKFLSKVSGVLSVVDNVIEREMYIKRLSAEYEISEEAIMSEVLKRTRGASASGLKTAGTMAEAKRKKQAQDDKEAKIVHNERFILSLLCVDNSIYNTLKEHYNLAMFTDEENRRIGQHVFEKLEKKEGITPSELLDIVSPSESGEFARILKEECLCDDNHKAILGKIREMEILSIEIRQKQILEKLKDKDKLPEGDVEKLKRELKNLTLKMADMKSI